MKIEILENIGNVVRQYRSSNSYCSSAALSIITGLDTRDTTRLIKEVCNKPFVCGVTPLELRKTLHHMKIRNDYKEIEYETLKNWLNNTEYNRKNNIYILYYTTHFAVIQSNKYCCSKTQKVINITDKHEELKLRDIITAIFKLKFEDEI